MAHPNLPPSGGRDLFRCSLARCFRRKRYPVSCGIRYHKEHCWIPREITMRPHGYDARSHMTLFALQAVGGSAPVSAIVESVLWHSPEEDRKKPPVELHCQVPRSLSSLESNGLVNRSNSGLWTITKKGIQVVDEVEDEMWRRLGLEQFLAGYCADDAMDTQSE